MSDTETFETIEDVERQAKDKAYLIKIEETLKKIGATYNDLKDKNKFRYMGGTHGVHLKYFKMACPKRKLRPIEDKCACGHHIEQNCYMVSKEGQVVIFGNCCIKKFVGEDKRWCAKCTEPHKNTKKNLCNKCDKKKCWRDKYKTPLDPSKA